MIMIRKNKLFTHNLLNRKDTDKNLQIKKKLYKPLWVINIMTSLSYLLKIINKWIIILTNKMYKNNIILSKVQVNKKWIAIHIIKSNLIYLLKKN